MTQERPPQGHVFSNLSLKTRLVAIIALIVIFFLVFNRQQLSALFQNNSGSNSGASSNNNPGVTLAAPVTYTQNGITLRVEKLTSTSKGTQLVYTLSGVPASETPPIVYFQYLNGDTYQNQDYQQVVTEDAGTTKSYRVTAKFEPLPDNLFVRLVWERKPSPEVVNSDIWVINLALQPISQ